MITLAFYKGPGQFFDKVIRWVTRSPYSHVAVIIDSVCYEADAWSGRVLSRPWEFNPDNWFILDVSRPSDLEVVKLFLSVQVGRRYDYPGIIGFALPWRPNVSQWWYCSELAAAALGLSNTSVSPGDLYQIICGSARLNNPPIVA